MKQFLKQTLASLIGTLAGLLLFFVLGTSGLVLFLLLSKAGGGAVKDKSVLVFDLSTQIADTKPAASLSTALVREEASAMALRQVIDSIDKAAKDDRIVGIFLDGRRSAASNGDATLTEVRAALERFRKAGKKIIAYGVEWGEKDYYLSSVADTIFLNPMGTLTINGFSSEPLFLSGALQKYGIGVQVVRAGRYKSAVEAFTRKNISPESRQQTQALLGDLWGEFLSTVAKSRKLTVAKLQAIADNQGLLTPEEARTSGLVDREAYFDQVLADLKQLTGSKKEDKSFPQIDLETYADVPVKNEQRRSSKNKIAIIYAEGTIVNGQGDLKEIGGDRFAKELRQLRQDGGVKAVVLRVNSPGGSATASDIILRELQLIRQQKPVIVSMGNLAASGGYWISLASDRIFAEPNTITGSIGVFALLFNLQKIASNNGLSWDVVETGHFADINTVARPKTEAELALYQKYVNQIYNLFIDKVAEFRNLSKEKVANLAQGRVWSGQKARQIGLVDRIGGLDAAIAYAAQKARLGEDWQVEEYPKRRRFAAAILEKLLNASGQAKQIDPLTQQLLKFKEDLTIFQTLNDPKGIYARLPFHLKIE